MRRQIFALDSIKETTDYNGTGKAMHIFAEPAGPLENSNIYRAFAGPNPVFR